MRESEEVSEPANMNVLMLFKMSSSEIRWSAGRSTATFDRTALPIRGQCEREIDSSRWTRGIRTKGAEEVLASVDASGLFGLLELALLLLDETTGDALDDLLRLLYDAVPRTGLRAEGYNRYLMECEK